MKNNTTEIVFILDQSGSMHGLEDATISGFNEMLEKQKKLKGNALVSTVLFDDEMQVIHNRVPIHRVEPLNRKQYQIGGCTALLDAVGSSIDHIGHVHQMLGRECPSHTIFVITTDGLENASRHYSYGRVRHLIDLEQRKYHWEFLFLGANIDAVKEASKFGIHADRAVKFHNDGRGIARNYAGIGEAVTSLRMSGCMSENWKEEIEEDYRSRKEH